MQLKHIMTHEVETIGPDTSLQQAAQKMRSLDVGMLPVTDGDALVGVITDRDITVRASAKGVDPATMPVRNAMTEVVIYGVDDQDIKEGSQLMMDNQIRRLPVVNRDKKLVGIVSLADFAMELEDKNLAAHVLERISESVKARTHV